MRGRDFEAEWAACVREAVDELRDAMGDGEGESDAYLIRRAAEMIAGYQERGSEVFRDMTAVLETERREASARVAHISAVCVRLRERLEGHEPSRNYEQTDYFGAVRAVCAVTGQAW